MIKCQNCNQEIPNATAKFCPHCGAIVNQDMPGRSSFLKRGSYQNNIGETQKGLFYRMPGNINYGTGISVWIWLCILLNAFAGVYLIVTSRGNFFLGLLGIISAVLYFLLWNQRVVIYFYGICIAALLMVLVNFSRGFGAASLSGLINPMITCLLIRKYYFDYNQSGIINPSNINKIFSVIVGLVNAALVFGSWLEIKVFSAFKQFSLFKIATIINDIKGIFDIFSSDSLPVELYILYALAIYFSIAAVLVSVLELIYFIFVVISHPSQYKIGKRASAYAISVSISFIIFIGIMAVLIYLKVNTNVFGMIHPTIIPFIVLIISIIQTVLIKNESDNEYRF